MLVLNDSSLLGDGRNFKNLRNEEALLALRARNRKDLDKYRWPDHEEITDPVRRAGQQMHFAEFLLKILDLNKHLVVQRSINFPDCVGVYHAAWKDDGTGRKFFGLEYLSSMRMDWLPEFSHLKTDWQDLPEEPVYGWRQVLVMLMRKRVLRWSDVKRVFGDSEGENATRWRMETRALRV